MTREITDLKVYWDVQDPANEGWAYVASDDNGLIASGGLDDIKADDLDGAIEEACHEAGLNLTVGDFAKDDHDGGCAFWEK